MKPIRKARTVPRDRLFTVEIIANYPKYKTKDKTGKMIVVGTFHAYITELDLDLRGLHYLLKKGKFYLRYPSKKGNIDGEVCEYLIFSFCSAAKQQALTTALKQALSAFSKTEEFDKKVKELRCEN